MQTFNWKPGGKIKSWLPHCWHFHWFHLGDLTCVLIASHNLPKPQVSGRLSESLLASCCLLYLVTVVEHPHIATAICGPRQKSPRTWSGAGGQIGGRIGFDGASKDDQNWQGLWQGPGHQTSPNITKHHLRHFKIQVSLRFLLISEVRVVICIEMV